MTEDACINEDYMYKTGKFIFYLYDVNDNITVANINIFTVFIFGFIKDPNAQTRVLEDRHIYLK